MDKLKPTNRDKANVEAEKGETVVTKFFQDLFPEHYEIDGKKHKDGGTPLSLPQGSFIFSDAPEMKIKDKNVLDYLGEKKAKTIAEIAKKYDLNKFKKILTDKNVSPIDRNSALVGMSNNLEKLGFLALYQEMMKGLPDGVPEISQEFLKKNPEYVDKINEILSKEKNTGTDGQQVPQAFMGMSFTANDFNDGPGNRKRKKSDDYVSEKLEPKPLDFSSLFKTNQSEQEEREISTNPSNTTPNNQQNNIDNQTPVRKYLGPPYHLESFLASKKQEILKDPIRGSYNPEISVKEKPTPDFPPNEYSPDGPWADPLSDTFRNTPAEKLETRSVFDQKTDQETQELKKSGLDKEFEENYKKIKEKSDEIDDKYYEKNIKKMTKEELKKLREDLESGKLKATVRNYNMSLVFPGGYQSMLMDKAMANWANWLEGSLQAAYASPVYNANRVYGSQPALSKGDYVQSGTSTGEYRPDRMTRIGGYSSFVYPYYPQSHPQMNEGGQVNKFDPGMAIKEIYERLNSPYVFAEGGPVGDSENKNNEQQKNIDLTGLIKDYLAKKYKHKAHVYGYDQRAIESAILKNLKYGTPGTTYSTHPLIMEIEDYMGQKYPEYQKALNKSRALFVKNEFGNDFSKFRDYLVEQKLMTTAHERDISNQYNQFYRDILNNKETPNEKNEDKNQTTSRAPENKKDTTDPRSKVFFGVLDIGIENYAKQHGKDSSWISQRREDISNLLKGKSTSSSSKKELTPLLQYLENEDILPSDVIKKMTNDIENTQKDNKDKKEPISPKYNKDKKETTPEKNTSESKENLNWSVFNEAIENAYNNLKAQLPDLVNSIYDKVYKDKKHTEQEKEIAKKNIEKLVLSSFDATKKGLYDSDGVSFSKQSKTSTAQTSKLNNQLKDLIAKGDKEAVSRYIETAMKINAVNNISNTNPQIFTNPEIRKSLESGNALMNRDAAAKLRKEYFDAWGLPNYGDPAKVKDDLGVALFQYSFNRNKDTDDDNIVLTSKDYQDGSNIYYKRPKSFREGLKSESNISAIDGYYGDRTQNQFMLDLGVFAEPKKEEPKKAEEVKTEQKEIKPEVKAEQLQTIAPKLKARGYYFLQDKNRIAQALHNLYSIRKRPPYEPEPMVSLPDYSLLDPSRALQASQQAYKMGMEQVGSYLPPQVAAAQVSMMSGQAATDAANIISDTQNKNVAIANQASLTTANLINNYLQRKENQMRSLHDKYTIMEERYTADRNKALANLTDAINNAITNAAKNQTINEILYKDSPYYVEPETGGTTHFDPRYAKDITMTAKKDRTTMMNELMGNLRKHNIDTSKMTPDDAEKWLRLYGISDVSGSETIEPGVKKEEKETFTPWWRLFPFNKNE